MSSLKILWKLDNFPRLMRENIQCTSYIIVEESKLKCKKCKFYSLKKNVWAASMGVFLLQLFWLWQAIFPRYLAKEWIQISSRAKSITIWSPHSPYISVQFYLKMVVQRGKCTGLVFKMAAKENNFKRKLPLFNCSVETLSGEY